MENVAKQEVEEPQEKVFKKQEGKVVNMVFIEHVKTCEDVDFSKILIDCGIRHCPPQRAGLLF